MPARPLRILLDTNVLISLEDPTVVPIPVADMARLAAAGNCQLIYHPKTRDDVERDRDKDRRQHFLSKVSKYAPLDHPPEITDDWLHRTRLLPLGTRPNNLVDAALLLAVDRDAVDLLVTNDIQIHSAARRVGVDDRVYYPAQCVAMLRALFSLSLPLPPQVKDLPCHALDQTDPIFASLRGDYPEYDEWFQRCCRAGRHCWVIMDPGLEAISALCIYKPEVIRIRPSGQQLDGLKLCTFKVSDNHTGNKYGELLLKAAFSACTANHLPASYCTVLPNKQELKAFLYNFGFRPQSVDGVPGREEAWLKSFSPDTSVADPLTYHCLAYPNYRHDTTIRKFVVPILPHYHDMLFPDCPLQPQLTMLPSSPAGNAIRKAYLSHSRTTLLRSGDLLVFYRSKDLQTFTSLGIVEDAGHYDDPQMIASIVGKRTVYTYKDILKLTDQTSVLVVRFRQVVHFSKGLTLREMRSANLIRSNIESIQRLDDSAFEVLLGTA